MFDTQLLPKEVFTDDSEETALLKWLETHHIVRENCLVTHDWSKHFMEDDSFLKELKNCYRIKNYVLRTRN